MLRNTLILPDGDPQVAARLLRQAIDDLDVVLMLIFGTDPRAPQVVEWADKLCNKGRLPDGSNLRHAVWVRSPEVGAVTEVLTLILSGPLPFVAVLNYYDEVKATLAPEDQITPMLLEAAFLQGFQA